MLTLRNSEIREQLLQKTMWYYRASCLHPSMLRSVWGALSRHAIHTSQVQKIAGKPCFGQRF